MWRFIVISFAFLGVAFYVASGGSSYAPSPDSLQVAMRDKPLFAPPLKPAPPVETADTSSALPPLAIRKSDDSRKVANTRTAKSATARETPANFAGLSDAAKDERDGFQITLASAATDLNGGDAIPQRPLERIGAFDAETLVQDVRDTPIAQAVIATPDPAPAPTPIDIRSIAASSANMRSGPGTTYDKVDQLPQGAQVEVLERRGAWMHLRDLDTGQTGWMADWLVTAAN